MSKKVKEEKSGLNHLNRIKWGTNLGFNLVFLLMSLLCVVPVVFVFMISISSQSSLDNYGYSFLPKIFSGAAYHFLYNERIRILKSLLISVTVTSVGTILGIFLTTTMGYVLSRRRFKLRGFYTYVIFIPMIFSGGMVASYVINSSLFHLTNTIWALILPLEVSSFNVIISKTFFLNTIPDSIVESAKIDGATQLNIFARIVMPISKPVIATIGLFLAFGYWNDWFQSSLYISDDNLISLQALLNNMMMNIQYIAKNPFGGLTMQQYLNTMPRDSVRMAIAILIVVPIACAYPFFQKYFITGLTIGAVKE